MLHAIASPLSLSDTNGSAVTHGTTRRQGEEGQAIATPLSGALRGIMEQEAAGIILGLQSSIKRTKGNQERDI